MAVHGRDGWIFKGAKGVKESFRPPGHFPPDSWANSVKFKLRLMADFQVLTVYTAMKNYLPSLSGKLMDVGCGQSPYRFLINSQTEYLGIDVWNADEFGYHNKDVTYFDGKKMPFPDSSVDHFICTETLEHTPEPSLLIEEICRVLKKGGDGIVTVPWSARFHYIPNDYFRFTPSALSLLFKSFSKIEIVERGNDLLVIVSKCITAYLRLFYISGPMRVLGFLMGFFLFPMAVLLVCLGHVFLFMSWGAKEDPLGYTIRVQK